MSTVNKLCPIIVVLIFALFAKGCVHPGRSSMDAELSDGTSVVCGPALSREEIIDIAQDAMLILWGDSSLKDFDVRIEPAGCDYHFFAIRSGREAAEDIFFSIDRSGRVNSFPECWWLNELGNCPEESSGLTLYSATRQLLYSEIARRPRPVTLPAQRGKVAREGTFMGKENLSVSSVCKPALRLVSGRPFTARSGPMEVHAIAVIAGCEEKLQKFARTEEEALITTVLIPFVLEKGGATSQHPMSSQSKLVADMNSMLGEELVSDVVVYRISWTERIND